MRGRTLASICCAVEWGRVKHRPPCRSANSKGRRDRATPFASAPRRAAARHRHGGRCLPGRGWRRNALAGCKRRAVALSSRRRGVFAARRRCPTCRAPVRWEDNPYRPFCSERCRMVDLGNWAAERYRVAGEPVRDDDENDDGPVKCRPRTAAQRRCPFIRPRSSTAAPRSTRAPTSVRTSSSTGRWSSAPARACSPTPCSPATRPSAATTSSTSGAVIGTSRRTSPTGDAPTRSCASATATSFASTPRCIARPRSSTRPSIGDDNFLLMRNRTSRTTVSSATASSSPPARCSAGTSTSTTRPSSRATASCTSTCASAGWRCCAACRAPAATCRRSASWTGTHTVRGINRVGLRRAGFSARADPRHAARVRDALPHPAQPAPGARRGRGGTDAARGGRSWSSSSAARSAGCASAARRRAAGGLNDPAQPVGADRFAADRASAGRYASANLPHPDESTTVSAVAMNRYYKFGVGAMPAGRRHRLPDVRRPAAVLDVLLHDRGVPAAQERARRPGRPRRRARRRRARCRSRPRPRARR